MPTFHFYKSMKKVDDFSGANPERLRSTIEKHRQASIDTAASAPPSSGGYVLGGSNDNRRPIQAQQLTPPIAQQPTQSQQVEDTFLQELVAMGFDEVQVKKALSTTNNSSVQAALDWSVC